MFAAVGNPRSSRFPDSATGTCRGHRSALVAYLGVPGSLLPRRARISAG
jgi:hypothetical protein